MNYILKLIYTVRYRNKYKCVCMDQCINICFLAASSERVKKQKYPFSYYSSHVFTFQSLEIASLSPTQESLNILFFFPGVFFVLFVCAKSLQFCPTLCHPIDCSSADCSVHEILWARIIEWVAISSSRGSS